MRSCTRLSLAASIAALVLAVAVGGASARRFEVSEQHFRIVWSFLRFASPEETFRIECPVTYEGSFHSRTISKVCGQLIGYITRAEIGAFAACRNKANIEAISLQQSSLPWHVRYDHFVGTLPAIEAIGVQLINMSALITSLAQHCLYKSTVAKPARAQFHLGVNREIIDVIPDTMSQIPLFEGPLCPANGIWGEVAEVTAVVTVQGLTTKIFVRLVQ